MAVPGGRERVRRRAASTGFQAGVRRAARCCGEHWVGLGGGRARRRAVANYECYSAAGKTFRARAAKKNKNGRVGRQGWPYGHTARARTRQPATA